MKRGFTLVELSIVLVIIGLLIGGILVAQSMADTARIQSQVRQIGQFDAAMANFETQYNAIPGDYAGLYTSAELNYVVTQGYNILGNGLITDRGYNDVSSNGASPAGLDAYGKLGYVWVQLQRGVNFGQDGATFSPTLAATGIDNSSANRNVPKASIEPNTGVVVSAARGLNTLAGSTITLYQLANYTSVNSTNKNIQQYMQPSLTPVQALAIDQKMDDGVGGTGFVQGTTYGNSGGRVGAMTGDKNQVTWSTCMVGSAYTTSNSGKGCGLIIQVMSQSGGLPNRATTY